MILKSFLIGFLASIVFIIVAIIYGNSSIKAATVASPLPLYLVNTPLAQNMEIWQPKAGNVLTSSVEKPQLGAKSAFVYDITTDAVLYEKNIRERLPVASLVKIMTAIVAFETKSPTTVFRVTSQAASAGENSMGISAGERYTLEELLYGLVLHSGNDAAEAIAEGVSLSRDLFVDEMNRKAAILGLADTYFANPSGLEAQGRAQEYSTAYDLAILTKYALTIPLFAKIAQTVEYTIPYSQEHKLIDLYNQTNLLTTYPGVKGVKTGYTTSSGLCLVTYAENGGHKLIGVVLDSPSRRGDMIGLLDYSFAVLGVKVPGRN